MNDDNVCMWDGTVYPDLIRNLPEVDVPIPIDCRRIVRRSPSFTWDRLPVSRCPELGRCEEHERARGVHGQVTGG